MARPRCTDNVILDARADHGASPAAPSLARHGTARGPELGIAALKFPLSNATHGFSRMKCMVALTNNMFVFILWLSAVQSVAGVAALMHLSQTSRSWPHLFAWLVKIVTSRLHRFMDPTYSMLTKPHDSTSKTYLAQSLGDVKDEIWSKTHDGKETSSIKLRSYTEDLTVSTFFLIARRVRAEGLRWGGVIEAKCVCDVTTLTGKVVREPSCVQRDDVVFSCGGGSGPSVPSAHGRT
eukprot:362573-Chlamydomonas_euryale.AAC.5